MTSFGFLFCQTLGGNKLVTQLSAGLLQRWKKYTTTCKCLPTEGQHMPLWMLPLSWHFLSSKCFRRSYRLLVNILQPYMKIVFHTQCLFKKVHSNNQIALTKNITLYVKSILTNTCNNKGSKTSQDTVTGVPCTFWATVLNSIAIVQCCFISVSLCAIKWHNFQCD